MRSHFLHWFRVTTCIIIGFSGLNNLVFTQPLIKNQIYPKQQFLKSAILEHARNYPKNFIPDMITAHPDAFFCRKERQLEKRTGFPIRVRLGDWESVELYEGKHLSSSHK